MDLDGLGEFFEKYELDLRRSKKIGPRSKKIGPGPNLLKNLLRQKLTISQVDLKQD